MKFKLSSLFLLMLNGLLCYAEQPPGNLDGNHRCGFQRYLDYKIANDPSLVQQIKSDEEHLQRVIQNSTSSGIQSTVYTIPVVVHVIYNVNSFNISDAQILSQIDVLNQDYSRTNTDASNTPQPFRSVASATDFQFCLAKKAPDGSATNGIERRQTARLAFSADDQMKFTSSGGLDAWDVDRYLNIWVCSLEDRVLGFGDLPSSIHLNSYGVVVKDSAFGRIGTLMNTYNLGRTCTHEISHCFDLYHVWGDADSCQGTDYVSDTPGQLEPTYGCHGFPFADYCTSSFPGIMFMNYMDYSDDACMNMFTAGQASRMLSSITTFYPSLLTSTECMTSGIESPDDFKFSIYPNPSKGILNLDMFTSNFRISDIKYRITDAIGKIILESTATDFSNYVHSIDLKQLPSGIYFITVYNENFKRTERFALNN